MAVLRVRVLGDPILRAKAAPVTGFDDALKRLADDMLDTMDEAPGVGLAAPQVGHSIQMFVYDTGEEGERGGLCNPTITWMSEETIEMEEGCLSIPGITVEVTRPEAIRVEAQTLDGEPVTIETGGFRARVFQHEIDHLNGVLFIDHLPKEVRKQAMAALRDQDFGLAPRPDQPFAT
jgi:peptide deformylase